MDQTWMSTFNIVRIVWTLICARKPLTQSKLAQDAHLTRAAIHKLSRGGEFAFLPFIKTTKQPVVDYHGLPPAGRGVIHHEVVDRPAAGKFIKEMLQALASKANTEESVLELLIVGELTDDEIVRLGELQTSVRQRLIAALS